jgi:cell division protein ZapD
VLRVLLYEFPFNENVRTLLRLEQLFDRLAELVARESALDHHFALVTLFEVLEVAQRTDLKGELMKDLERQKSHFNAYRGNPAVSEVAAPASSICPPITLGSKAVAARGEPMYCAGWTP